MDLLQKKESWYFLDSGFNDAATNMAIDELLIDWHSKDLIKPTLRFYGWERPSLTVGHFQNVKKTINMPGLTAHKCDFVRRLTGGSAVLHDDELTYSIVVSEAHPNIPKSVNKAYYILSQGLLAGYQSMNIPAEFSMPEKELTRERTAVCFEKPASYEMIVNNKKISGNAQTRKKGVLLQHGSIPLSFNHNMLFDLFAFSSEKVRERQKSAFLNKAISINDVSSDKKTYDDLKAAFYNGFKEKLDVEFEPLELTSDQWKEINALADSKYRTDTWNLNLK